MAKEIETKFKIESEVALKKSLKQIGAKILSKNFEKDTYYHHPAQGKHFSLTIRLRSIGTKGVFTVKAPTREKVSRTYKVREELEVDLDDVRTFGEMLKRLGFVPRFRKEKRRETYGWKDAKVSIDELPFIGFYAEIEAPRKRIRELATLIGLDMAKAISETYMGLFNYYKTIHKKPHLELIFKK